jgi:hypothetical protein
VRSEPDLWMAATRSRDLVDHESLETHHQRGNEARIWPPRSSTAMCFQGSLTGLLNSQVWSPAPGWLGQAIQAEWLPTQQRLALAG